jgi:hypothetical protein
MHSYLAKPAGNVGLSDGSVHWVGKSALMSECVAAAVDTHANCVLKPNFGAT